MTTFSKILADVDPRARQQPALERVAQVAVAKQASVRLAVCEQLDDLYGGALVSDKKLAAARKDYQASLENWLDEQAGRLRELGVDVSAELVWHAPRYEAVLERAADFGADLIMRSARHHSRLERLLISATDWELVRHAPQTVWLVKKKPAARTDGIKVLAAVDPVHSAEGKLGLDRRILDAASTIANINGGTLHIVHAWQPGAAIAPAIAAGPHVPMPLVRVDSETIETMRQQRKKLLRELTADLDIADERIHLAEGPVTDAVDSLVQKHDIDAVVAGGVSRGRLERLVIGSTAEAMLGELDCDVVIVKPATDKEGT